MHLRFCLLHMVAIKQVWTVDTIPIRIEAKKGPKLLIIKTLGDLSLLNHLLNISN